ncbi:MAG: DNA-cytosine methyltransferase [Caulobacteraceae bacterium]|nr:DNA-cytosine methyltransferase [Caulobacteraceae bacterium]
MSRARPLVAYEFFAGGGMARAGLGAGWSTAFANDFDPLKADTYRANWPADAFVHGDVWAVAPERLPGRADLAWASSPCQDFSLAGGRAGLKGGRSSAFWGFWRLIEALAAEDRAPRALVIENVCGLLSSHGGADFAALGEALAGQGYRFGALEIDAAAFLPQSRPRVFIVATREPPAHGLLGEGPFHTVAVRQAHAALPEALKAQWLWWSPGAPPRRNTGIAALLDPDGAAAWHRPDQTRRLLSLMAPLHRAKVEAARAAGGRQVGAVFRRTRIEDGRSQQRAEVRFDGMAGCLRTPRGGSSRQILLVAEDGQVRSRLLSGREGARLMGLADDYVLPRSATGALHVVGDGVAVPVVRFLAQRLLEPLLGQAGRLAAE